MTDPKSQASKGALVRWSICSLLAGSAVILLFVALFDVLVLGTSEPSTKELVAQGGVLKSAIERYQKTHGRLPKNLTELPRLEKSQPVIISNWMYTTGHDYKNNREIFFLATTRRSEIVSYSPDKGWEPVR